MEPFADFAQATAKLYSNPMSPFSKTSLGQRVSAGYDLIYRLGKDYVKPEFGIKSIDVDGVEIAIHERIEMNKPYYASAAVRYADKNGPGEVSFTLKDLANDDEPLLHDRVVTNLTGVRTASQPIQLGGKGADRESSFHGVIDDLRLSAGALADPALLYSNEDLRPDTLGFWRFENKTGTLRDSSSKGRDLAVGAVKAADTKSGATPLAALCHALLNSSEFLYVE